MRKQRLAMVAALAGGVAIVGAFSGGAIAQPAETRAQAPAARIASVDVFALAERMMNAPELTAPRDQIESRFRPQLAAIEEAVQGIDARLAQLQNTPNDPQVRTLLQERQTRAEEYQQLVQQAQQQREEIIAQQVAGIYSRIRDAAQRLATQRGYTHVVTSRSIAKPIEAATAADALQEMLARPLLIAPEGDDLTSALAAELNVDMSDPAPTTLPAPGQQPGQTPAGGANQPPGR